VTAASVSLGSTSIELDQLTEGLVQVRSMQSAVVGSKESVRAPVTGCCICVYVAPEQPGTSVLCLTTTAWGPCQNMVLWVLYLAADWCAYLAYSQPIEQFWCAAS
jgi:hypothetical protein